MTLPVVVPLRSKHAAAEHIDVMRDAAGRNLEPPAAVDAEFAGSSAGENVDRAAVAVRINPDVFNVPPITPPDETFSMPPLAMKTLLVVPEMLTVPPVETV